MNSRARQEPASALVDKVGKVLGLVMLGLAGGMMFMGSLVIGKIVNFKV